MKKYLLKLFMMLSLILTFNACGGGSSNESSEVGEYDLSGFFMPSVNDTQVLKEYVNTTDSDASEATLDETKRIQYTKTSSTKYSAVYTDDSNTELYTATTTLSSSSLKVQRPDGEETVTYNYPRYVDLAETFNILNSTDVRSYADVTKISSCEVVELFTTKTFTVGTESQSFNNVLQLTCTHTTEVEGKTSVVKDYTETDIVDSYYAKGIGEVFSYDRNCLDASSNLQDDQTQCPGGEEYGWNIITNYTATPTE